MVEIFSSSGRFHFYGHRRWLPARIPAHRTLLIVLWIVGFSLVFIWQRSSENLVEVNYYRKRNQGHATNDSAPNIVPAILSVEIRFAVPNIDGELRQICYGVVYVVDSGLVCKGLNNDQLYTEEYFMKEMSAEAIPKMQRSNLVGFVIQVLCKSAFELGKELVMK